MCTLIYCCRSLQKKNNRLRGSLCLRFVYGRKSVTISTGFILHPEEWDSSKRKIIQPISPTDRSLYLQRVSERMLEICILHQAIVQRLEEQGMYSAYDVARAYRYHNNPGNLSAYCHKQEQELSKFGQIRTARAYRSAVRSLMEFNVSKELALQDITASFLKEYERYLKGRGKSLNTISFYMRNLRSLYNKSVGDNILLGNQKNPFSGVYTGVDRTKKRALNLQEMVKLRDADMSELDEPKSSKLSRYKRFFFFCFHARGMSFIDMAYLRKDNIRKGIISYYRKKTGQLIEIKLTAELKRLIQSFEEDTKYSDYVFPIIIGKGKDLRLQYENGLREYNKGLKDLANLCSIKKAISSHVARHSWATIAKHERLPLAVISEGLGHSNEKTTYIYLASFERSFLDEANELIGRAVNQGSLNSQLVPSLG